MDKEKLQQIISNPDNVLRIIDELNDCFKYLYFNIQKKLIEQKHKDIQLNYSNFSYSPETYYLNGHCPSYANILCEIFGEFAEKYNSDDHIIIKIKEHFYDVRGLIDNIENINDFHKTENGDLFYIDITFGIKDNIEKPLEKELIKIGSETLEQIYNISKQNKLTK